MGDVVTTPNSAESRVPHRALKISASMGGRPGRWVCSCGKSKTDTGFQQVWQVRLSFKEHSDGK